MPLWVNDETTQIGDVVHRESGDMYVAAEKWMVSPSRSFASSRSEVRFVLLAKAPIDNPVSTPVSTPRLSFLLEDS